MEKSRVPTCRPRRASPAVGNPQLREGRWRPREHQLYLEATWTARRLSWDDVSRRVGTRSTQQCISHDQKFKSRVQQALRAGYDGTDEAPYAEHAMPTMEAIVARLGEVNVRAQLPSGDVVRLFGAKNNTSGAFLQSSDHATRTRGSTPPSLLLDSSGVAQSTPSGSGDSVGSAASRGLDVAWAAMEDATDDLDLSSLFEVPTDALPLAEDPSGAAAAALERPMSLDGSGYRYFF